jgi:hypothetical protein
VLGNPSRHRVAIVDATTGDQLVTSAVSTAAPPSVGRTHGRDPDLDVVAAEPQHSTLRLVDVANATVATNYILDCVKGWRCRTTTPPLRKLVATVQSLLDLTTA